MYSGSCLCGDIGFVVDGPIEHVDQCHCSMCRKAHGAAFATYGGAAPEHFRMLRGESLARSYRSSPIGRRIFCPRCGSVVPLPIPDKPVAIALGNVEQSPQRGSAPAAKRRAGALPLARKSPPARPKSHFFVGSKAPWHDIVDDLPQFDEYPPSFGFDANITRQPARPAAASGATRGSCLCGAVAFEFNGRPVEMVNCHCGSCRRAMSAGFATYVTIEREAFRWLAGESNIVRYSGDGSPHAGSAFCGICGSPMPRTAASGRVDIPAGSLDDDPGVRPGANLNVAEKADWVLPAPDLPAFATVPAE